MPSFNSFSPIIQIEQKNFLSVPTLDVALVSLTLSKKVPDVSKAIAGDRDLPLAIKKLPSISEKVSQIVQNKHFKRTFLAFEKTQSIGLVHLICSIAWVDPNFFHYHEKVGLDKMGQLTNQIRSPSVHNNQLANSIDNLLIQKRHSRLLSEPDTYGGEENSLKDGK